MLNNASLNNKKQNFSNNEIPNKSKKKKSDKSQIKSEDDFNARVNFPMQNQIPIPVNQNNPMCFNTGFYFNNVPNNVQFNLYNQEESFNQNSVKPNLLPIEFVNNDLKVNEFANCFFNNFENPNNSKEGINTKTNNNFIANRVKDLKGKNLDYYPNGINANANNLNDLNLKKIKNDHFANNNIVNSNKNSNQSHNNISKSAANKPQIINSEVPIGNQISSQSQPNLMPIMGFPNNFYANPHFINNPVHQNINTNNSNQFNPYTSNFHSNINENSFTAIPQNYRNPIPNNLQFNKSSINKIAGDHLNANYNKVYQKHENSFYPENPSDDVIDKNKFLNEFVDFNNNNSNYNIINKQKDNYFKDSSERNNSNDKLVSGEKKIKNQSKKSMNQDEIKAKEENKIINFNNFKDILAENEVPNIEGNLLAITKKLSTVEENKDGKSLIQNNYQVTIINGYNLNENSEIRKNFITEENILNNLRDNKNSNNINNQKSNPTHLTQKIDSLALKSNINNPNKNQEFLNYLEDPKPSIIKQISKEENSQNENSPNKLNKINNRINDYDIKDNEFFDFNKIMKKNSNNKTPNMTSDYYAYKFTSGGESLKLDLNFDKKFYQSTRQNNKQKVELFIPIDEDDFKNKIENNSKKQKENEMRQTLQFMKGGCVSGTHINISQNENLNESFDKEFGDSYGPKKSMFFSFNFLFFYLFNCLFFCFFYKIKFLEMLKINREDRIFKPY